MSVDARQKGLDVGNRLAALVAALALVQSAAGVIRPDAYRDNAFVRSAWYGNDLVTLSIACPLLIAALFAVRRRSIRGQMIVLGVLDYMLYNYAFYLFGAAFNAFFMLYALVFALSVLAMIYALSNLDASAVAEHGIVAGPRKWIAAYMLFVATGLTTVYIAQWSAFVASGELPVIVTASGHPTSIVFALDLTLLVPYLALGALWLWRARPWGYVLATVLNVKGALYTLVLTVGSLIAAQRGFPAAVNEVPLWATLTFASALSAIVLVLGVRRAP